MRKPLSEQALARLAQVGERERALTAEAVEARAEIADLVRRLLPQNAPPSEVARVVEASGYSRALVDALRSGRHSWQRPDRPT